MTTFALIHGGGGSGWDFHRLGPELVARGHDFVAPDLPITDPSAGLADFTDTVLAALGDTSDVAVVGHSYGGFTAPLVASKLRARLLVYLAGMIPAPGEPPGQWWTNTGFAGPSGLKEIETFFNGVDPALASEGLAHGRDQVSREGEDPWPLPTHPDVPTRAVLFRDDRFFTPDFQRRIARERLGLTPDEVDGPHCAPLSHPAPIADLLVSYL